MDIQFADVERWDGADRRAMLVSATAGGRSIPCVVSWEFLMTNDAMPGGEDAIMRWAEDVFARDRVEIHERLRERIRRGVLNAAGEVILDA